jgi:hypothetical protein
MKIQESTVQLAASHEASFSHTQETTTLQGFRQLFASLAAQPTEDAATARQRVEKMLQSLVDAILAAIDGKKGAEKLAGCEDLPMQGTTAAPRVQEMSWQRTTVECISESEQTSVCGNGKVRTSDGREINFDYSLDLARDFSSKKTTETSGTMQLRDPLVINFDGKSTELTQQRIRFDLNADGTAEEIPGLGAASGFLVLDRNANGKADDGSELFGTASGNGFADLARLDADHNGWIDESDPAWQQMAVWSGERFSSLKESGVGALYTGAVEAPFSLKTSGNELLGQIRAAGLYLSESGVAGSLQQVDLAVSDSPAGAQQPAESAQLAA